MDEKLILTLVDKFSAGNIGELELSDGGARLLLRKASSAGFAAGAGGSAVHPGSVPPAALTTETSAGEAPSRSAEQGHGAQPASAGDETAGTEFITSPIVGTFYPSPGPDVPPFVRAGSKVKTGDTLCILEAMKMMNQLVAEFDCEIVAVKAAGGDMVEYGQELFEVKRPG
jgi:acetyl-CoA carboxylase biotin carboxyl carrier protein